jgi:hypothetical protein
VRSLSLIPHITTGADALCYVMQKSTMNCFP